MVSRLYCWLSLSSDIPNTLSFQQHCLPIPVSFLTLLVFQSNSDISIFSLSLSLPSLSGASLFLCHKQNSKPFYSFPLKPSKLPVSIFWIPAPDVQPLLVFSTCLAFLFLPLLHFFSQAVEITFMYSNPCSLVSKAQIFFSTVSRSSTHSRNLCHI